MGEAELKAALQREMEARVRQLWHDAEALVQSHRSEVAAERDRRRKDTEIRLSATVNHERSRILFAAQQQAARARLRAEAALVERLRVLAEAMLPALAGSRRDRLWSCLLDELPPADWQLVRVHPADAGLAQSSMPGARVETDRRLGGGLVVEREDGLVRIDNSLQKRLERCWPELLPALLTDLRTLVEQDHGPVESDTSE